MEKLKLAFIVFIVILERSQSTVIKTNIQSHSSSKDARITPFSDKFRLRYGKWSKLYVPEGFSIFCKQSFVNIKLWISFKESYISLVTPICDNCLSLKIQYSNDILPAGFKYLTNLPNSNTQINNVSARVDKNLIKQYLGKIYYKCENSKTKCYSYNLNNISGKIISQTLSISAMNFPQLYTLILTKVPKDHILAKNDVSGIMGFGRSDYDISYKYSTFSQLSFMNGIKDYVMEVHLTNAGHLLIGGTSKFGDEIKWAQCKLKNTFEYSCQIDGLFVYYQTLNTSVNNDQDILKELENAKSLGLDIDEDIKKMKYFDSVYYKIEEERIVSFVDQTKEFRFDPLDKYVYLEKSIFESFIEQFCRLLVNHNQLEKIFIDDIKQLGCIAKLTSKEEFSLIVTQDNYNVLSGLKFGILLNNDYQRNANVFAICEDNIDYNLSNDILIETIKKYPGNYKELIDDVKICFTLKKSKENILGNTFQKDRIIRIDQSIPSISLSVKTYPKSIKVSDKNIVEELYPMKIGLVVVEIILGILLVFFVAINCDKLIGDI